MKIAFAQLNPIIGDIENNSKKAVQSAWKCYEQGAELVLFPELFLSGYPPLDLLFEEGFVERCFQTLVDLIPKLPPITIFLGLPTKVENQIGKPFHNSVAIITNNKLVSLQNKHLLPTYDVFDEKRYFLPGPVACHQMNGCKIGLFICEDMWAQSLIEGRRLYPDDPINALEKEHPDLVVVISASPFSRQKQALRETILQEIASRIKCPVASINQVGAQDSLLFDGGSCYVSSKKTLFRAKSFEEDVVVIDTSAPLLPLLSPEQELEKALVMGIRDYFHKQNFSQALLGLSGGIDSSLVAYLAVQALGAENVLGVLLPSKITSQESNEDALALAKNLKIETRTISIEEPIEGFLSALSYKPKAIDLPYENLQARVRGAILMTLANAEGRLLLATSNKSEVAMGYSTLYGDTCGALCPLGDLLKTELYALARLIPAIPKRVLTKVPTAELRIGQTDQESLPAYEILDPIIQELVVNNRSVESTAQKLKMSPELVKEVFIKIQRSEFKRRQIPPLLKVSAKAFNVGRVFPIVQKIM